MRNLKRLLASGTVVSIGLVSLLLGSLAVQGVSAPLALVFASAAVFSYVVLASGRWVLRIARASDLPRVAAWPLGVTVTGVALLLLVAVFSVTAALAFALWAVAITALDFASARLRKRAPAPDGADLIGLALCCTLVAAWCKDLAAVPAILAGTGQFPAWSDYFLHAGVISQFGDARAIGRGAIWLADTPWFLYHYASYTLPAVFAWPLDQPGLPLATSLWAPIGILCLACATYTLGATLAGAAGGVAALAALLVLPDASNYGLRNGFFSFHWNLLASPTASYALATALLAIVFLHRWIQTRSAGAFAISAALALATVLFRAHVFILLFPAWLAIVAIASHTVQRRRVLFLLVAGAFAIGAVFALRFLSHLPAEISWVFDEGRALERFLHFVHRRQEPTAYQGLYLRIGTEYGETAATAAGVLLVYVACLGLFVLLYPLALALLRRRLQLAGVDGFPLALLVTYAFVLLVAPIPAHHDASDFTQRPFVLLYAVVAAWTAASLVRWLSEQGRHGLRLWQTLLVGTAIAVPFLWMSAAEMARPKFYWSRPFAAHTVASDLLAAAGFLRSRAQPGDTLAAWPLPTRDVGVDAPTELVALTAVPAYLARVWIHEALGGANRIAAVDRYRALGEVARAENPQSALQKMKDLRVRWYVVTSRGEPAWDPQRSRATWARGAVAIYDSTTLPSAAPAARIKAGIP